MILGGQALLDKDHKRFPKSLPLLAVHGTADNVPIPPYTFHPVHLRNTLTK